MNDNANGMTSFKPESELTIYTAQLQKDVLSQCFEAKSGIIVDLSSVKDIDSAGLQLLLSAKQEAKQRNITFTITGYTQEVLAALELCNLSRLFGEPVFIPSDNSSKGKAK